MSPAHSIEGSTAATTNKGVLLILLWNMLVGITYGIVEYVPIAATLKERGSDSPPYYIVLNRLLAGYGAFGLVQMLYPVSGLLADVRYGRYTVIKSSLAGIIIGLIFIIGISISSVSIKR